MPGSIHVWHGSDALWSPPRKVSSEDSHWLFYQPGTLGVKGCWSCSCDWGSRSSSWLPLAMTLDLWTFALEGQEGRLIFSNKEWQWDTWRIARVYTASPSLGYRQTFLVLTEDSGICFHLRSCTEGNGSHQRKVIFRICFVLFLKVDYLKRIS